MTAAAVPIEDQVRQAVAEMERRLGIQVISIAFRTRDEPLRRYRLIRFADPYYRREDQS
jgi:hypothetical protein